MGIKPVKPNLFIPFGTNYIQVILVFTNKCPLCGTQGTVWNKSPEAFRCPNCASIFSRYGMVVEAEEDTPVVWH
jgi:hypothetical protein